MSTEAIAIVAARGGSQRLRGKALRPFSGKTLIGHKVWQLQQCFHIGAVFINTDDEAIATEACAYGALLLEGKDYDGDSREMLADSCQQVLGRTFTDPVVLWAHPTNPLVQPATYDLAIQTYGQCSQAGCDSLLSVYEARRHAWCGGKPLNYDPQATRHPVAADLDPIWFQDGAIFIQTATRFVKTRYFFGDRPKLFPIPFAEGLDIDTEADLRLALALEASHGTD